MRAEDLTEIEQAQHMLDLDNSPLIIKEVRKLSCSLEVLAMISDNSNLINFLRHRKVETVRGEDIYDYECLNNAFIESDITRSVIHLSRDLKDAMKLGNFDLAEKIHNRLQYIKQYIKG